LIDFENKITDRFGPLPEPAIELLESIKLKWVATQLGMERLIIKKGSCICYFISDQQSEFFQTKTFSFLLTKIQEDPDRITLKEKNTPNGLKLILTIQSIGEIQTLTELLDSFVLPIKTLNS
jgi:transcription-repair coupling factor (superfamily II helicase)